VNTPFHTQFVWFHERITAERADPHCGQFSDTLVDVREKGEMEQGTIAGAINLPYREIRARKTLPSLVEPVAVFCNSGNRSSVAASLLERMGLSVMNVAGGTTAWIEAGLPLAQPDV